jgi:hypothetical protein
MPPEVHEMHENAERRLLSGEAWEDFCENLKGAGRVVDRFGDTPTDLDRAEWYRFLSRLLRNGLERFVENCEPERPRLRDAAWRGSINVQNPDQDHLLCEFENGEHSYRITGNRGTLPYFVIAVYTAPQPEDLAARDWASRGIEGLAEFDPTNMTTTSFLTSRDIEFDEQGNFELFASQNPHPRNWLQLEPDSTGILLRTVHHDRAAETPPVVRIERLDGALPRPMRPYEASAGLAKAAQEVLGYAEMMRSWWQDNLSKRPNQIVFSESTYLSNGGVLDRLHGFGSWQKPMSDALVVEFHPPECEHWILQLCNIWQENLDVYEEGQGFLTKFTADYESDGSVRVVIADQDPQVGGNWVDSFSHTAGVFSLRLIQTAGGPEVTIHQVPLERLRAGGFSCLDRASAVISGQVTT